MLQLSLVLVSACTLFSLSQAGASSTINSGTSPTESRTTLGDSLKDKKFEDNQEITDAKLKADSGSLSRYSLKFVFSYAGAPVGDLNNPMQPNPDGSVGVYETNIGGSVSGRFRINKASTIGIGTGVTALTPFQGVKRYDVKNPFISYDITSKLAQLQIRNSISYSAVTNVIYRNLGEYGGLIYDNSLVYNLGLSAFAIALDSNLSYYLFERGYDKKDKNAQRYSVAFYPAIKYNLNDQFNVNTSLNIGFWNPRNSEDHTILMNKVLSQRLAVGYGYSHDIYFSPYLNFYPSQFGWDSTTINFSTTFSVL